MKNLTDDTEGVGMLLRKTKEKVKNQMRKSLSEPSRVPSLSLLLS